MTDVAPTTQTAEKGDTPTSKKGARLVYLDTLRGLMLVLMAVNHIPSNLHTWTDHPLGYMSAAEGFVFLSGLMAGMVYTRKLMKHGDAALRNACIARALTIYRYHLATFFAVLAGVVGYTMWTGEVLPNAPLQIVAGPAAALVTGPLLLLQPALLDILPMYCAFLLATPLLIQACEAGHRRAVMIGSVSVWALVNAFCAQVPLTTQHLSAGALNICAWQLPFVVALVFGHAWARGRVLVSRPPSWLVPFAVGAAVILFAARHSWLSLRLPADVLDWLTNKNNLAPLRLANTALLFWLLHAVVTWRPAWFSWKPLAFLGQASMPVFTVHVLVAYVIHAAPRHFDGSASARALGTSFMLAALFATAAWKTRQARKPVPADALPSHSGLASGR